MAKYSALIKFPKGMENDFICRWEYDFQEVPINPPNKFSEVEYNGDVVLRITPKKGVKVSSIKGEGSYDFEPVRVTMLGNDRMGYTHVYTRNSAKWFDWTVLAEKEAPETVEVRIKGNPEAFRVYKVKGDAKTALMVGGSTNLVEKDSDKIVFEANEGYKLDEIRFIFLDVYIYESGKYAEIRLSDYLYHYEEGRSIEVDTSEVKPLDLEAVNNFYNMSAEDLQALSESGFIFEDLEGSIDFSQYMINLFQFPLEIPTEFLGEREPIKLGKSKFSKITPVTIERELVETDLGEMVIPAHYGNGLDLLSQLEIRLPFTTSVISLPYEMVVGKKIAFKYITSLYDGTTTINVNCEGSLLHSEIITVGRVIPYKTYRELRGSINGVGGGVTDLRSVTATIKRPKVEPSTFSNLVIKEGSLSNEAGYVSVSEVRLRVPATSEERRLIINSLNSGVFIGDD